MKKVTTRFNTMLAELAQKNNSKGNPSSNENSIGEGAFVPFVTLCDPDLERSFDIICTLVNNGADALELGLPFSDPLLDGEVIQAANQRALSAGHSTEDSFKLLERVRAKYPDTPISLLLCANLIFAQTLDGFYKRCADIGVDAVLVADVPLMECLPYCQSAVKHGVQPVLICPPNGTEQTIAQVASLTQGYTYLVSRAGVTSADNQESAGNLDELVSKLKANNSAPILQGFGIAKPEQVKDALDNGCAGAISGSAIVRIIENNLDDHQSTLQNLGEFVRHMKQATT
ncbi:tryptophan synthase subunit alpha [Psychrobacter sp. HD31]|uniref:tryptophan synthase subunit alpha n=1 Tax=Psychrobacter sp. HD31 TaxID=3112003 RepID=UPI003DA5B3C1